VDVQRVALLDGMRERADGKEQETAQRWLDLLPRALSAAREASEKLLGGSSSAYVVCHGDLWPAHVYFDGDAFAGFVDFESLVFAPPALDLAQLIGHFGGWNAREDVLRAYERIAPLEEPLRAALALEIVADLASEGLWSLQTLYDRSPSKTTRAQREAHTRNLGVLLGRLEGASREAETIRG
jgi:Ser/Thr protein kinase RdoA (MazF antagonist)